MKPLRRLAFLACLLVAATATLGLAGCGSDGNENDTDYEVFN